MQCTQWRPPKKQKSALCVLHCYMTSFWKHVAVCCSITQSCPTLWDPMNSNTPGFPVLHHLLEFAQTHVRWVGDAIQPSHPLSSPSPPAFNPSQHQGLFQWVGSLHQMAKILELQLQHQSLQWMFRIDFFQDWLVCSPCCPWDSQGSSPAPQCKGINSLALNLFLSSFHIHLYDYWKNHSFVSKVMSQLFNMLSRFVIAFLLGSKHLS